MDTFKKNIYIFFVWISVTHGYIQKIYFFIFLFVSFRFCDELGSCTYRDVVFSVLENLKISMINF